MGSHFSFLVSNSKRIICNDQLCDEIDGVTMGSVLELFI